MKVINNSEYQDLSSLFFDFIIRIKIAINSDKNKFSIDQVLAEILRDPYRNFLLDSITYNITKNCYQYIRSGNYIDAFEIYHISTTMIPDFVYLWYWDSEFGEYYET